MVEKVCTGCGKLRRAKDFYRDNRTGGLRPQCKPCHAETSRAYHERTRDRTTERQRAYRASQQDRIRESGRAYKYGLAPGRFDEMLAAQGGRCAICRTDTPRGTGTWHIDHDHACCPGTPACGKCVRGLLCSRCNLRVLPVVEDAELLAAALRYLAPISL